MLAEARAVMIKMLTAMETVQNSMLREAKDTLINKLTEVKTMQKVR